LILLPYHVTADVVLRSCGKGCWEELAFIGGSWLRHAGYVMVAVRHFCKLVCAKKGDAPFDHPIRFELFWNLELKILKTLLYHDCCDYCANLGNSKIKELVDKQAYMRTKICGVTFQCTHGQDASEHLVLQVGNGPHIQIVVEPRHFPREDFLDLSDNDLENITIWMEDDHRDRRMIKPSLFAKTERTGCEKVSKLKFIGDPNEHMVLTFSVAFTKNLLSAHGTSAGGVCGHLDCEKYQCCPNPSEKKTFMTHVQTQLTLPEEFSSDDVVEAIARDLRKAVKNVVVEQFEDNRPGAQGTVLGNPNVKFVKAVPAHRTRDFDDIPNTDDGF